MGVETTRSGVSASEARRAERTFGAFDGTRRRRVEENAPMGI